MRKINTNGKIYIDNGIVYRPDSEGFVTVPGSESIPVVSKESLLAKALELELGDEAVLELMTAEELTTLIAEADDTAGDEKTALVEKALALKVAAPSAIKKMSVEKLTTLIAEAEGQA